MIIVHIMGGLGNQIAQYAFGLRCASRLGVELKLDITSFRTYDLHAYGLNRFTLRAQVATDAEIIAAKANGVVRESTLIFDNSIDAQVRDGVFLYGYWGDYRYSLNILTKLQQEFQPVNAINVSNVSILAAIKDTESVSLHIRRGDYVTNPNCVVMPLTYYEDAVSEILFRTPNAHIFVFSDDLDWVKDNLRLNTPHTFVEGNDASRNVDDLELMRACKQHIIANSTFSFWSAMLDFKKGLVIAPQQYFQPDDPYLIQTFGQISQPVWPPEWLAMPLRKHTNVANYQHIAGGQSLYSPIRVCVWNYYESLTTDGFIFRNSNGAIGHNLLKPWCDLHAYGQANGIDFVTLDQVTGPDALDALIFQDRPRMDNPVVAQLLKLDIPKYLYLFETEVIKPDNWDADFHRHFDRVFTWSDAHVDDRRYIKQNFAIDPESPYDFEVLKTAFHQRKLCTLIAGAKGAAHKNELYSERIRAIQWFQTHAPQDFDFYGIGWDQKAFPAYRGAVQDKLATLARYRFAICYENAKNYPGYITEKILDCFRAGVIPIYLGASNIDQWIPSDCFIDRNEFNSEAELYQFIRSMPLTTHEKYLDRINLLFQSQTIYPFTTECLITTLTTTIVRDIFAHKTGRSTQPSADFDTNALDIIEVINRANLMIDSGETTRAIELYQSWIQDTTSSMRYVAAYNLAGLWIALNETEKAEQAYTLSLELNPSFLPSHQALNLLTNRK